MDAIRITFNNTGAAKNPLVKLDLIGISNKKAYKANPVLDQKEYLECKYYHPIFSRHQPMA